MKTRKKILLGAVAVLACAYALQLASAGSGSVEKLVLGELPDAVRIEKGDGSSVELFRDGDRWTVGSRRYPADAAAAAALVDSLKTVKVLGSVSAGDDPGRYGLDGEGVLAAVAMKGGAELRRLAVGKASATSRQTYVRLDGGREVLLVSGNLKRAFEKTADDLRDRTALGFDPAELTAVRSVGVKTFQLAKSGGPEAWKVSFPKELLGAKLDAGKLRSWISGLSAIKAEGFAAEGVTPPAQPLGRVEFELGSRAAALTVHGKIGDSRYLCASTESPYLFFLSEYVVGRLLKPLDELLAE